jgi:hypothetical protein
MLLTAMPRAAQAALSMQSVPVAATAISFSCGSLSSASAVIGTWSCRCAFDSGGQQAAGRGGDGLGRYAEVAV